MSILLNLDTQKRWMRRTFPLRQGWILIAALLWMCKDPLATGKPRPYCEGECENGRGVWYSHGVDKDNTIDYAGVFENGYLKGQATITWGNGVIYRGNVQWNSRSGMGIRRAPNEPDLEGFWVDNYAVCLKGDCTNSFGELTFIDLGAEWAYWSPKTNPDGPYFMQVVDWDQYIGDFKDHRIHGCGAVVREGKVDWGLWNDNRLVKNRAEECREQLKEAIANDTGERFVRCFPSEGCVDESQ